MDFWILSLIKRVLKTGHSNECLKCVHMHTRCKYACIQGTRQSIKIMQQSRAGLLESGGQPPDKPHFCSGSMTHFFHCTNLSFVCVCHHSLLSLWTFSQLTKTFSQQKLHCKFLPVIVFFLPSWLKWKRSNWKWWTCVGVWLFLVIRLESHTALTICKSYKDFIH